MWYFISFSFQFFLAKYVCLYVGIVCTLVLDVTVLLDVCMYLALHRIYGHCL